MSGNPNSAKVQIPVIIELPEAPGGETIGELKQLVAELRELVREAHAPLSFTEQELADYFGISKLSLERLRRAGKIQFKRVAGKIHYSRRHVEEFINSGGRKG
jgi:hypothetical protein